MKWIRFRVCTTTAAEDLVIDAVQELGLEGAQIENHVPLSATEKEQMFVDILPDAEEDDGTSYVSFYAEEAAPGRVLLGEGASRSDLSVSELQDKMTERLAELKAFGDFCGDLTLTVEETEDVDWINNWKTFFHQFRVDDILILPSWEEPEEGAAPPALVLHIDPGTAFGTGMHETTQLCIRAMREYLTPKTRLLDIGTGSGILAILALKLGIAEAVGTDLDPQALPAVIDNLYQNGLLSDRPDDTAIQRALKELSAPSAVTPADQRAAASGGSGQAVSRGEDEVIAFDLGSFRLYLGDLIDSEGLQMEVGESAYDVVLANILPDVLVPLTPAAARALKKGGVYITSGILAGREEEVVEAMQEAGLTVLAITAQGEWRCVVGQRQA